MNSRYVFFFFLKNALVHAASVKAQPVEQCYQTRHCRRRHETHAASLGTPLYLSVILTLLTPVVAQPGPSAPVKLLHERNTGPDSLSAILSPMTELAALVDSSKPVCIPTSTSTVSPSVDTTASEIGPINGVATAAAPPCDSNNPTPSLRSEHREFGHSERMEGGWGGMTERNGRRGDGRNLSTHRSGDDRVHS